MTVRGVCPLVGGSAWWPAAWTGSRPSSPPGAHHTRGQSNPAGGVGHDVRAGRSDGVGRGCVVGALP